MMFGWLPGCLLCFPSLYNVLCCFGSVLLRLLFLGAPDRHQGLVFMLSKVTFLFRFFMNSGRVYGLGSATHLPFVIGLNKGLLPVTSLFCSKFLFLTVTFSKFL